jgi:Predicted transcriptional regulators
LPILKRIKELREERKLTQKLVSKKLNIPQNTYSQYENGKREIKLITLIEISKFYDVSICYLLDETELRSSSTVTDTKILSKRLRKLRIESGYTQEELAKQLGIAQGTYSRYGTKTRHMIPSITRLKELAEIFNVSVSYLLGETDDRPTPIFKKSEPATFAERINFLRTSKGKSQAEVAKNLGLSRQAYNNYERGDRFPNIETIEKLAEFFNVSVEYLVNGTNEQSSSEDD